MADTDQDQKWSVLLETLRTTQTVLDQWVRRGRITRLLCEELKAELQSQHQSFCLKAESGAMPPAMVGFLPLQEKETAGVRGYRAGIFVSNYLRTLRAQRRLTLSQAHALQSDAAERLACVQRILSREGFTDSDIAEMAESIPVMPSESPTSVGDIGDANESANRLAAEPAAPKVPRPPAKPRRPLIEILLDPRSIQCLLGLGGALMVVGLVILLWLNNFFTAPMTALVLAASNAVVLGAGLWLILKTRFQMAGKAVALLACGIMPLNLWYSHANQLMTVDGHLWVPAVLISGLYLASAWILKDKTFVYVFCGGITLTGLLILASIEPSPERFREIASPATLLVILGLIGVHLERAFSPGEGPFSRSQFGMAFFWSGHAQIAAGLILLLGAQVAGDWLYEVWFKPLYVSLNAVPSPVCGKLRWLSLLLVLAGIWSSVYSDLVVRRRGIFVHIAGGLLLWAEILTVQILDLHLSVDAIIAIMAVTSLLIHTILLLMPGDQVYTRSFPAFGLVLGLIPVLMGLIVYFDNLGPRIVWSDESPRWTFVGAMILAAIANRIGAMASGTSRPTITTILFFSTGGATMIAAIAALAAMGLNRWQNHAPLMILLPIGWLTASHLYGARPVARPLWMVAHAGAVIMLVSSLATAFGGFLGLDRSPGIHLSLAVFFAEAALFYALSSWFRKEMYSIYASSFMTCAAFWQVLAWCGFGTQAFLIAFAVTGFLMLIVYRLSILEFTPARNLSEALFFSANGFLSLSFVSSVLYGLSRIASDQMHNTSRSVDWSFAVFCFTMLTISILSTLVTNHPAGRRWYIVTSVGQAIVTVLAIHQLINLSPWQQVELFSIVLGIILLTVGHIGWYREQGEEHESDLVSVSLLFGSLLTAAPLAIATWIDRGHGSFRPLNEFGFLFVGLALLVSGIMFQLKYTSMIGALTTVLYFLTLLIFVPWSQLNAVALAITAGGGFLFGTGLVLAFFRDRLLTLPNRIRNREGIFRVFNWR